MPLTVIGKNPENIPRICQTNRKGVVGDLQPIFIANAIFFHRNSGISILFDQHLILGFREIINNFLNYFTMCSHLPFSSLDS
jgi:hypothetical protein